MLKNITKLLCLCIFFNYASLNSTKIEILAKVNNQIITNLDLEYRVNLAFAISNIPNEPEFRENIKQQMLNLLIDESLKIQEAERLGILISSSEVYSEINRGLSSLHEVNVNTVGLTDFGADGNYYERQISRWAKQYLSSETEKISEMSEMMEELPKRIPMDNSPRSLVHGDFRLDNMIFHKNIIRIRFVSYEVIVYVKKNKKKNLKKIKK